MDNDTIHEAVGFIEAATDNIKKALATPTVADGITLEQFLNSVGGYKVNVHVSLRWHETVTDWMITLDRETVKGKPGYYNRIPAEWPILSAHVSSIGISSGPVGTNGYVLVVRLKEIFSMGGN